jgi:hypothetical protein
VLSILLCACDVLLPDLSCSSLNPLSISVFFYRRAIFLTQSFFGGGGEFPGPCAARSHALRWPDFPVDALLDLGRGIILYLSLPP